MEALCVFRYLQLEDGGISSLEDATTEFVDKSVTLKCFLLQCFCTKQSPLRFRPSTEMINFRKRRLQHSLLVPDLQEAIPGASGDCHSIVAYAETAYAIVVSG